MPPSCCSGVENGKTVCFSFFAFVPGLSTSFLTAAADKDRCRDLGEVFCLKIHRFLVFCRSVYFGIVLDTPLLPFLIPKQA